MLIAFFFYFKFYACTKHLPKNWLFSPLYSMSRSKIIREKTILRSFLDGFRYAWANILALCAKGLSLILSFINKNCFAYWNKNNIYHVKWVSEEKTILKLNYRILKIGLWILIKYFKQMTSVKICIFPKHVLLVVLHSFSTQETVSLKESRHL